jgi:5-formyltetrahydrofolate cyclo-ligase
MKKEQIRKIYLQKRLALSEAEFQQLNEQLCKSFFDGVDLSFAKVLHTFLPIEKHKEVNTWLIIDHIQKEFPGIRVSVPRINNQTSTIESFYLEGPHQLEKNIWDIPEPKQGIPTPIEKIDTVLVPLLAVDSQGNRVGYGRGFYDKFLNMCSSDTRKIGLSLFPPVDFIEGLGPHDLPVDLIVTPQGCFNLKEA